MQKTYKGMDVGIKLYLGEILIYIAFVVDGELLEDNSNIAILYQNPNAYDGRLVDSDLSIGIEYV